MIEDFLPPRLKALIESGRWPGTKNEASAQNLQPLVKAERVQLFAPGETQICLMAPPFRTLADHATGKMLAVFWSKYGALDMISPKDAVIIADFGIGSDSPIVLDCREAGSNPPVLWLRWANGGTRKTEWIKGADSFDEFAKLLAL